MTFSNAIDAALKILGLGTTQYAHDQNDSLFLQYANACVLELTKDVRPVAFDEVVSVTGGTFLVSSLTHPIYQLLRVRTDDRVYHTRAEGPLVYLCDSDYTGNVKVTYEYYYTMAADKTATIPLPEQYHQLVPLYITGQFYLTGDRWQQRQGQAQLQLFQELRRDLKKEQHGSTDSYKLKNRGW